MRKGRTESSLGIYHIMSRGNDRKTIFHDQKDQRKYLNLLRSAAEEQECEVLAWCLMTNHVHLLVRMDCEKMSEMMKSVNQAYATSYNEKYQHVGHVFQGRFKRNPVESERYLKVVFRYILRNPWKAHLETRLGQYRWSSFGAYNGKSDGITSTELMTEVFGKQKYLLEFVNIESRDTELELAEHGDWMTKEDRERMLEEWLIRNSGTGNLREFLGLPRSLQRKCCADAVDIGFHWSECEQVTGLSVYKLQARSRKSEEGA